MLAEAFPGIPWFEEASIGKLMSVERPSPRHRYWPDLDIDLSVDSIRNPERLTLVARGQGTC